MSNSVIPVGTITLCYCRRALVVIGNDHHGRPAWTHLAQLDKVHHPSPLWWDHTLDEHELRAVELRRENKRLRGAIDSIRDIASTALGKPALRTFDNILAVIERIEKP